MATEKGKRRRRKPHDPAQYKRLIEAARSMGLAESGEAFKKALDKAVPKKGKTGGNN